MELPLANVGVDMYACMHYFSMYHEQGTTNQKGGRMGAIGEYTSEWHNVRASGNKFRKEFVKIQMRECTDSLDLVIEEVSCDMADKQWRTKTIIKDIPFDAPVMQKLKEVLNKRVK